METFDKYRVISGRVKKGKDFLESSYEEIVKLFMTPYTQGKKGEDTPALGYWAVEQLAAYLYTALTNPSIKWLSLKAVKEVEEESKVWIQEVEETIYSALLSPETNFNNQIHEFYLELVGFGTAIMYIQESPLSPFGLHYINIPIKECYIQENYLGEVDSLVREFTLSQREVSKKFDLTLNEKEDLEKEVLVTHLVYAEDNNYLSIYYIEKEKKVLSEEVLEYFPFLVSRWSKKNNNAYGSPPTIMAMSELKKIKQFEKILITQAHYAIEPAWFLPSTDVQFPINRKPGGVNFFKSGADKGYSLPSGSNINIGEWVLKKKEDSIIKCFYLDLVHLQHHNSMTATEVNQRTVQHARILSPVTSRIESELLRPLIIKTFFVLKKFGKIEDHQNQDIKELKFEYISTLSKGQRYEDLSAISNVLENIAMTSKLSPEVVDNVNWDDYIRKMAELHNAPLGIFRSRKDIEDIRRQRQQQMEEQASNTQMVQPRGNEGYI